MAEHISPPPDDHTIDGYQIVSTIAMGGTGQVLEVLEPGTSCRLAMKRPQDGAPGSSPSAKW